MSGEMDKMKGRVKQAAGDLTDDEELRREGERDETAGKVKNKVGEIEDDVEDAIDKVKSKVND
jgi:uncharacterized protein YjbJ (UPF0337 family)